MLFFAHRTEHGGSWRYIERLGPGDEIALDTPDGRTFHYAFWSRKITSPDPAEIYGAGLDAPSSRSRSR